MTGYTTNFMVVQPVVIVRTDSTTSREAVLWMLRPIALSPATRQSTRATSQSMSMRDWWHDPTRLITRSCATCLRPLAVWNHMSRVLHIAIELAANKNCPCDHPDSKDQLCYVSAIYLSYLTVGHKSQHVHDPCATVALFSSWKSNALNVSSRICHHGLYLAKVPIHI